MSHDLQVWLTRPVELEALLTSEAWTEGESAIWVRAGKTWQLLVGPLDQVEPADVPDEVAAVAPGTVGWLVGVTLEGRRTGEAARALRSLTEQLASDGDGIVEDASGLYRPDVPNFR